MKILYVIGGKDDPGSFPFVRRQIRTVELAGVTTQCYFLESRSDPRQILPAWRDLRKTIRAFQPDIVHAQYGSATAVFARLATRRPSVVTFRGSDLRHCPEHSRLRNAIAHTLSQIANLLAARTICVSELLADSLWRKKNVAIIPSGVDLDLFQPRCRSEAQRELNLDPTRKFVLFNCGRSPILKGLALAEQSVQIARQTDPQIELLVIRGGVPPSQMCDYFNAASATLLCSVSEGSPNVVKESMACNTPVVSVDVGDVKSRFGNVNGCYVVSRDPHEMAAAIQRATMPDAVVEGRSAVESISEHAVAQQLLELYRELTAAA